MIEAQVACRSCDANLGAPVLSLGSIPLANALLSAEELDLPDPRYPLELVFCPRCSLVQLNVTVSPTLLYENYVYQSSYSDSLVQHAREISDRIAADYHLDSSSQVIEIASNDGYLLQHYQARGIPALGIEPAREIATLAKQRGIETLNRFFDRTLVEQLVADGVNADVVHAHNVLAHVSDLPGVVDGVARLLKTDGVWIVEVPYLLDLIDNTEFDTIYHEHLCYFSMTSLQYLMKSHGLRIKHVERLAIHGGSLRLFVTHEENTAESKGGGAKGRESKSVDELLELEESWGVHSAVTYQRFAAAVQDLKSELRALLTRLKGEGRGVAAYGASAKGTTLLNYFEVGRETIDFVVDRSQVKQGMFTPGTHLPILAPAELMHRRPDDVLLLTWNFADEILQQQAEYRSGGGKFIIPIPKIRVV
jgi:SAM-dependent methyltransferase